MRTARLNLILPKNRTTFEVNFLKVALNEDFQSLKKEVARSLKQKKGMYTK